jgi:nicotinate-nucleotide pyrophosphorylase (carboxylating)
MSDSLVFTPSLLQELAHQDVARALLEDVGAGDLTAALVDPSRRARARVRVREAAVIAGSDWVGEAFTALDPDAEIRWHVPEGGQAQPDTVVLEVQANARALITAERTA